METNDNEYGFSIEPNYNKVRAEIYKVSKSEPTNKYIGKLQIHLVHKEFGAWFRKQPIEKDYIEAREWADKQIQFILNANK